MVKYHLVALDIDGTLLTSKKTILSDTIKYINEASKKGIHIVYCSGRAPAEMQDIIKLLPIIRYGVCMSGSLVYDFKEKKVIYANSISKKFVKEIIEAAKDDDGMIQFLTENESIVREDQITHMSDFKMGIYQPMYSKIAKRVKDMNIESENYDSIPKINIYFHSTQARQKAYEKIKNLPLCFSFGEETALEITAKNVNKGNGLSALANYLRIQKNQIIGIGDADNDISFLKIVGLPSAMGNANEKVKSICKVITDDNDHDGTGKSINEYCLEN